MKKNKVTAPEHLYNDDLVKLSERPTSYNLEIKENSFNIPGALFYEVFQNKN